MSNIHPIFMERVAQSIFDAQKGKGGIVNWFLSDDFENPQSIRFPSIETALEFVNLLELSDSTNKGIV